jgi:hypothetical protein
VQQGRKLQNDAAVILSSIRRELENIYMLVDALEIMGVKRELINKAITNELEKTDKENEPDCQDEPSRDIRGH